MDPALLLTRAEQEAEIVKWTPYAHSLAFRFWDYKGRRWGSLEDWQACAVEGLWEAARRFQPAKGCQFSTYATAWVKQAMHRYRDKVIGTPSHWMRKDASPEEKELLRRAGQRRSLSAPCGTSGELQVADLIADYREAPQPEFPTDFWGRVDKWLDPLKRQVIRMRYHDDLTQEEVGSVLGLTRERIRQHEAAALNQLRTRADFGDCVDDLALTRKL